MEVLYPGTLKYGTLKTQPMRHLVLSLSLLYLFGADVLACSCSEILTFCESFHSSMQIDSSRALVVRATVIEQRLVDEVEIRLILKVNESFHNPRMLDTIQLIDGNGGNCLQPIRHFANGQELIIQAWLKADHNSDIGWISTCSAAPLMVHGEAVSGSITDEVNTTSLTDFRTMLDCHFKSLGLRTYPNPAQQYIWIEMPSGYPMDQLTVYDNLGQTIYVTTEVPSWGSKLLIDVSQWSAGIYYIHCQASNGNEVYPLLVSR